MPRTRQTLISIKKKRAFPWGKPIYNTDWHHKFKGESVIVRDNDGNKVRDQSGSSDMEDMPDVEDMPDTEDESAKQPVEEVSTGDDTSSSNITPHLLTGVPDSTKTTPGNQGTVKSNRERLLEILETTDEEDGMTNSDNDDDGNKNSEANPVRIADERAPAKRIKSHKSWTDIPMLLHNLKVHLKHLNDGMNLHRANVIINQIAGIA